MGRFEPDVSSIRTTSPVSDGSGIVGEEPERNGKHLSSSNSPPASQADTDDDEECAACNEGGDVLEENPFDSEASRILFDAMDQLQGCGLSQKIGIPQLVIVGAQSAGKSSLLQSLTDIPFPVGAGCCTRFATRIVSRRTAVHSKNQYKISIIKPDFPIDGLAQSNPSVYETFLRFGEVLTAQEFEKVMEEVSEEYLGIRGGRGADRKNFATEVLKVELSGPQRSHFSILDVPGIFSNPSSVNEVEMRGVTNMVTGYMKNPENIVICVADAVTDLARQDIFVMAAKHVDRKRLVGVFTKCDMLFDATEVVSIATGQPEDAAKSMHDGWFVVRNRSSKDKTTDKTSFSVRLAEENLFGSAPWNAIREERRGSAMLRRHLSSLLGVLIADSFPVVQENLRSLLAKEEAATKALGDPRPTHHERVRYLGQVVQKFENIATSSLNKPGVLAEHLRARCRIKEANEAFARLMKTEGHTFSFEDQDMDAVKVLSNMSLGLSPQKFVFAQPPSNSSVFAGKFNTSNGASPASKVPPPPTFNFASPQNESPSTPPSKPIFDYIRDQIRSFQSTQLPGLVNPDVMPLLFEKQARNWEAVATKHLQAVAIDIGNTAQNILGHVCGTEDRQSHILYGELRKKLSDVYDVSLARAMEELRTHCRRECQNMLQTTDPRFHERLRALRTIRLLRSLEALRVKQNENPNDDPSVVYNQLHASMEENMVKEVHDVLKVYYQISIESFIHHVTHKIIEGFVSDPNGPLQALTKEWVYGLGEDEVEKIAREDHKTIALRETIADNIARYRECRRIADYARFRVRALRGQ